MKILASSSPGEVRVAAWGEDGLVDYAIWRPGAPDGVGDVYRGRVIARMPAMAGAFVDLGDAEGFLPDSEGASKVTVGDIIDVRVTRSAQGGKGPRLGASETTQLPRGLVRRGPDAISRLAELHQCDIIVDDPALAVLPRRPKGSTFGVSVGITFFDDLEQEVDAISSPEATLPGGARLSVYPTPALTAIDIDLAAASADRRVKSTAQAEANRALLPALARQIRLRNLAGAILVDLAGMPAKRRVGLAPAFAESLAGDPLRPRFLGFTALGLAEILRSRVHPPLHELLNTPHAAGLAALRQAAGDVMATPSRALALRTTPEVITALQADTVALPAFAQRAGRPISLRTDRSLPRNGWIIEEAAP